jgi:ComF family protein
MISSIRSSSFIKGLGHLFYPNLCEGCRTPLLQAEAIVCLSCEAELALTNYHHIPGNETAVRLYGRIPFVHATSLAWFTAEGLLQHLIHGLKYKGRTQTGLYLGRELGKAIKECGWNIDTVVPVPLHKKKEASRGYNQTLLIAEGIGEILNIPVLSGAIIRTRNTETQTDKNREERIENVARAFAATHADLLRGKHILLIDDVLTTGATLESCALEVLKVDNVNISIATIGIATS